MRFVEERLFKGSPLPPSFCRVRVSARASSRLGAAEGLISSSPFTDLSLVAHGHVGDRLASRDWAIARWPAAVLPWARYSMMLPCWCPWQSCRGAFAAKSSRIALRSAFDPSMRDHRGWCGSRLGCIRSSKQRLAPSAILSGSMAQSQNLHFTLGLQGTFSVFSSILPILVLPHSRLLHRQP